MQYQSFSGPEAAVQQRQLQTMAHVVAPRKKT